MSCGTKFPAISIIPWSLDDSDWLVGVVVDDWLISHTWFRIAPSSLFLSYSNCSIASVRLIPSTIFLRDIFFLHGTEKLLLCFVHVLIVVVLLLPLLTLLGVFDEYLVLLAYLNLFPLASLQSHISIPISPVNLPVHLLNTGPRFHPCFHSYQQVFVVWYHGNYLLHVVVLLWGWIRQNRLPPLITNCFAIQNVYM